MDVRKELALVRLARAQHGVFTRAQALACGFSPSTIDELIRNGTWLRLHPGVYCLPAVVADWNQRVMGALMAVGPGAAAARGTAAALWNLADIRHPAVVQVVVPQRRRRSCSAAEVRVASVLDDRELRTRGAILLTSPARTVVDLAESVGPVVVEDLAIEVVRRRLATVDDFAHSIALTPRAAGVRSVRDIVASFDPGEVVRLMSRLESLFMRGVVRRYRLPTPAINAVVDLTSLTARLDARWADDGLDVEADGLRWHSTPSQKEYDDRRQNELVLSGIRVLRYGMRAISREHARVAAEIWRGLGRVPLGS